MKKLVFILSFILSFQAFALAEGVYTIIVQKQEEKKSSRWTLADWLVTKQKIALMDQWLALNSSENWFEFVFDYGQGDVDEKLLSTTTKENIDVTRLGASMYIKFLGFEYEKLDYNRITAQDAFKINFLLLGSSVQSTHIRAFWGKRDYSYENYSSYDQSFWGGSLSLYLASFLGGEFTYTMFSKTNSGNDTFKMHGHRAEYGGFIELWLFRFYANVFREKSYFRSSTLEVKEDDGVLLGVKLFL
jgi:hypothetical protein